MLEPPDKPTFPFQRGLTVVIGEPRKRCLREPIVEIFQAAVYLDAAVSAHLEGKHARAAELICSAMPAIREWTESLWGKGGPWTRPAKIASLLPFVPKD